MRCFKPNLFFLLAFLWACGNSPTVNVRIQVASSATPANLMQSIHDKIQNQQSTGIYFRFDELKFCPANINDFEASSTAPSINNNQLAGVDPTKSSFTMDTSTLDPNKIYSVRMLVLDKDGNPTNTGYLNCPMSIKYPDLNPLFICFGNVTPDPLCTGVPTPCSSDTTFKGCCLTPEQTQACK